ncbi:MAG: hypothetical protein ACJ78Q_20230 [Chloroflexia bacterium]
MIDWNAKIEIDRYKERVAQAERNYEVNQALYGDGPRPDASSKVLRLAGTLLVDLGKKLQRRGGKPALEPDSLS